MNWRNWICIGSMLLLITGCAATGETPASAATAAPTSEAAIEAPTTEMPTPTEMIPVASATPSPTIQPTEISTPGPTLTPIKGQARLEVIAEIGKGALIDVAYSADGKYVAAATSKGLYLLNAETFEEEWTIPEPSGVTYVIFSKNGERIAYTTGDRRIIVIDAADYQSVLYETQFEAACSMAISPDGSLLAYDSCVDREVDSFTIRNIDTNYRYCQINGIEGMVSGMAFSPDGTIIATGTNKGNIDVWNLADCQSLHSMKVGSYHIEEWAPQSEDGADPVHHLTFSPDGTWLAAVTNQCAILTSTSGFSTVNGTIHVWDTGTYEKTAEYSQASGIPKLAFTSDSSDLLFNSIYLDRETINCWNIESDEATILAQLTETTDDIEFASQPNKVLLIQGSMISLLEISTKQTTHTLNGFLDFITDLEYSPDGSTLAAGFGVYDYRVRLWNARTAEYLGTVGDNDFPVDEIVYSPDGETIVIDAYSYVYKAGMIGVWNVESGEPITEINRGYYGLGDLHFSPDGNLLYAIHFDWPIAILIWQIPEKDAIERFEIKGNKFALSPDGSELAIVMYESLESPERTLEIWDVHDIHNRQLVQSAVFELGWLDNLMYSPNGRYILFISEEDEHSTITQVKTETLQPIYTFDYESSLNNFDISANGHYLAAGAEDGSVLVWNLETHEVIAVEQGPADNVESIAFCPDGTCLATASRDTITIWSLEALE